MNFSEGSIFLAFYTAYCLLCYEMFRSTFQKLSRKRRFQFLVAAASFVMASLPVVNLFALVICIILNLFYFKPRPL